MSCSSLRLSNALTKILKIAGLTTIALLLIPAPAFAQNTSSGFAPQALLRQALESIQHLGIIGVVAFILLYGLATIAFFPGSVLTLGAGVVFGVFQGTIYVLAGAILGAILAFLIGRYLARDWVAQKIAGNAKFKAIDGAIGRQGLKIVLLARLSPVFPFVLLNYALGITSVSLNDYILGFAGMIPGTIMYVYLGSLAGSLAAIGSASPSASSGVQWAIRIGGFIATVAVTLYITRIARKALAEAVPDSAQ